MTRHGTTCDMCVEFEADNLGPGSCRWASQKLTDAGFPCDMVVRCDGDTSADECKHFEMSARGVALCEEYGIEPGRDFPATLHAGADVPRVEMEVRR